MAKTSRRECDKKCKTSSVNIAHVKKTKAWNKRFTNASKRVRSNDFMGEYVLRHGKEKTRVNVTDNGLTLYISNIACDGKIYFVVRNDFQVIECLEVTAKED